jgi:translation initiation factor eIF-2B subunit epsilon
MAGSSQILVFEDSHKKQDVRIPLELMADRTGLSFHGNLLDCHVDICSPELMVQFSDNFDYQVRVLSYECMSTGFVS